MADLIDRHAAIKVMTSVLWHLPNESYRNLNEYEFSKGLAEFGLNSVPSVQPERTEYIPDTKAIPSERDCVDLSERVTTTFYDEEHEEWSKKTVTIRDVLDSVCDEYTILPSVQPEQKWIPVTERLPKKYGWYMCTLKDYRVNTYYWNNKGEWIDNGKKHFFELYNISSRYTGEDITAEQEGSVYWTDWVIAWMPLPEPYREEGEQGRSDQDREGMVRRIISICDDARLGYNVGTYNNCNNCGRKECQFKPEWGETIWWKCPLWEEGEK